MPGTASLDFSWVLIAMATGVVCISLCVCALSEWARADTRRLAPEDPFNPRRKLNGLQADDNAEIELIGSRPDSERPAGVDWSISTWSDARGKYHPSDRGSRH